MSRNFDRTGGIEFDEKEDKYLRGLRASRYAYYVTMDDAFLSGWGHAEKRNAKFVYGARDLVEAQIIADNARARGGQRNIHITQRVPFYDPLIYRVEFITPEEKGNTRWYQRGGFIGEQ